MDTVLFVIEYIGKVTLNNEYTATVDKLNPLVVEWFPNNDFIIETESAKFIINTSTTENTDDARIIKIEPNIYIIRLPTKEEESAEKTNYIAADRVEYSPTEVIAIKNLGTLMGHVRITKFKSTAGKISVGETYIATAAKQTKIKGVHLPFAFLQCVSLHDYGNAKSLISFEISDKHLETYFGSDFEILEKNYLEKRNIVSIVPHKKIGFDVARNITFQTDGEKITNVL